MPFPPEKIRVDRPWGNFVQFTHNEPTSVKIITVNPGESLSLQTHEKRDEFWRILSGNGHVTVGDAEFPAQPGAEFCVLRTTQHRVRGGDETLVFLEIAFGDFDEHDIVRLSDAYGRA